MPVSEWDGDGFSNYTTTAIESGLRAASITLVQSVKAKLGARGATVKMLKRGRALLKDVEKLGYFNLGRGKARERRKRDYIAAVGEQQFGKVDPPGGYPRVRTGNLLRSTDFERVGGLRYEAGYRPTGAAHIYGQVHEFGNRTTPARPVWNPSWKGEQVTMFEAFVKQAKATYETGSEAPDGE